MIRIYVDLFGARRVRTITPEMMSTVTMDISRAVRQSVRDHYQAMADSTKSTKYWPEAKQAVGEPVMSDGMATMDIRHKGVRLHWLGGKVKPTGKPSEVTGRPTSSLLIPFRDSPLRGKSLASLHYPEDEVQVLLSLKSKLPYLARIETQSRRRKTREFSLPDREGKKEQIEYKNSYQKITPLGLLLKSVTIKAKPEVMPTRDELQEQVVTAARRSLTILYRQQL